MKTEHSGGIRCALLLPPCRHVLHVCCVPERQLPLHLPCLVMPEHGLVSAAQSCTEQWMPFVRTGKSDMFWDQPFDSDGMKKWCWDTWRVVPRPMWPEINWGGHRIETATNIVFSNGKLDPWSGGGILEVLPYTPCSH